MDHAVVLNLSQLYGNGLRLEEIEKHYFQNDFDGKIQADYPSKFSCGFVVTLVRERCLLGN